MIAKIDIFEVGTLYTNEEIYTSLSVSNAGGVRLRLGEHSDVKRMVIMTSAPQSRQLRENPYHDRIEGDVLVYTGAGRVGDQGLSGLNRRLPQQVEGRFPIYLFILIGSRRDKSVGARRWQFLGMVEFLRHYQELQGDVQGASRLVWIFEFQIHDHPRRIPVALDREIGLEILAQSDSIRSDTQDDRQIAAASVNQGSFVLDPSSADSSAIRTRLLSLHPRDFEQLIKDVLMLTGFERVVVTKYSQDGGIDVAAYTGKALWPLSDLLIQVQAKRWLHTVGRREVAELRGSLDSFARGVVVTTSHFSKAAVVEATASGKSPIVLVDGNQFGGIIQSLDRKLLDRYVDDRAMEDDPASSS